jgi:hypothetical protein
MSMSRLMQANLGNVAAHHMPLDLEDMRHVPVTPASSTDRLT